MKQSLFSVSYAGLWGQHTLSLNDFITKAASLGFDSVMLMGKRPHLSILDYNDADLEAVQQLLNQHSIACDVIGGYVDLSSSHAAEIPYLEMQIDYVQSLSRIASKLGAKIVRVFTAYESSVDSLHNDWKRVVTTLQEMSDRAKAYDVTIAIQNHHDIAVHTDALTELLYDIDRPNCKLGFDAWSPALRGEDLYEVARKMAPHTAITTNADYIRLPRFQYQPALINYLPAYPDMVRAVKFGEGFIDYEAFFRGLKEGGFDGIANYEMCSPLRGGGAEENLDAHCQKYLEWMKQHELT